MTVATADITSAEELNPPPHHHHEDEVEENGELLSDVGESTVAGDVASSTCQEIVLSNNHHHHRRGHPRGTQQAMADDLAVEHRIFLRAILDLLTEREHHLALHAAADSTSSNAIKIGYLRKASRRIKGLWKTKFVEIRKGIFSYFDATSKKKHYPHQFGSILGRKNCRLTTHLDTIQQLARKDIPLRTSTCTCSAIKSSGRGGGLVFELRTHDGRRRLWMANSQEERQDWMQTIHNSMIGASVIRGDNFLQYQVVAQQQQQQQQQQHGKRQSQSKKKRSLPPDVPYRECLEQYLDIRAEIHDATTKHDYCAAVSRLHENSITVPVQWIKAQLDDAIAGSYFVENEISSCVKQLWKDLLRDTIEINGEILSGDSFYGPERIVGKLTQLIFSSSSDDDAAQYSNRDNASNHTGISEAQAIAYARDILLASGRTRSGGDSYFCAENLCLNRNLVVLCPSSSEVTPLSIKVVSTRLLKQDTNQSNLPAVSVIALTRRTSDKIWTRQYLVLSNGVLSCYSEDETEPRILLEKVKVQGAKVNISREESKDHTKTARTPKEPTGYIVIITTNNGKIVREFLFEDESDFILWHDSLKLTTDIAVEYTNFDEKCAFTTNGYERAIGSKHGCCSVDVVINVCTEYNACTLDPSGIDSEDTWATLKTTFVQKFSLTGGPNGRMSRGDEVVQLVMQR